MIRPSGEILQLFSESEMDTLVECLSQVDPITVGTNICKGIDQNHIMYRWFENSCMAKIRPYIDQDARLVFGMYLEEYQMWGIHSDSYHCDNFLNRRPYLSMIIPYSVDYNKFLVNQSSTIIFEESSDDYVVDKSNTKQWTDNLLRRPTPKNNAMQYYDSHLSHNNPEILKKLTLRQIYQWSLGSLIYWESTLIHDSDNFIKNGYSSKQAIVIHTYKTIP